MGAIEFTDAATGKTGFTRRWAECVAIPDFPRGARLVGPFCLPGVL